MDDSKFYEHVRALRPALDRLLAMSPVPPLELPFNAPKEGVYVLTERGVHLYVGRSNDIRGRLGRHCREGATHRMAAFAFRLARKATGNLKASYKRDRLSRNGLMEQPAFVAAFVDAKARIRAMEARYVEETHPVRQSLLEIYVAVTLNTPFNDFDNH